MKKEIKNRCGKELHQNIGFTSDSILSRMQHTERIVASNVMKRYVPSWSLIRGVVELRLYLHWKHLQT